ncbi:hypothetical protein SK069_17520 [Patulibacter brassicae]|uniref:Uncharacterized protein n=1 Tax=Patulibacter brassicae TaxID=1705717 RepID=A0ABU4VNH2_9ACTN|nr:hypothetical protein [Patulibacter brassicae]MDX8153402.1 hypothetical protein [Patulibacter brassicae]
MRARLMSLVVIGASTVVTALAVPTAASAARACSGTVQAKGSLSGGLGWEVTARQIRATGLGCASARRRVKRLAVARAGHGARPKGWRLRSTRRSTTGFPRVTYQRGRQRVTFTYSYAEG